MIEQLFRWLNVLLIFITFVTYLAPYIDPETFWWLSGISLFYPAFLLLNVLFIVGWLFLKKWYFLLSLSCLLVGYTHFMGFVGWHFGKTDDSPKSLHVLSYNVYNFRKLPDVNGNHREKDYSHVKEFFKEKGPVDLFLVQESANNLTDRMASMLGYPQVHTLKDKGVAILSRFPITDKGSIPFENSYNSAIWANIKLPNGKTIRAYCLHLQSNRVSEDAQKIASEGDLQERETWRGIKGMFRKYKHALIQRARQAEQVAAHIAQSPYPVIVGADLNDTPQSYAYFKLINERMLQDGFKAAGRGLGTTYAGAIPALRIDYILVDRELEVREYTIYKEPFSDHYAVSGKVQFK